MIYADEGRVVDVVRDGGRMGGTNAGVWNRFIHVWTLRDRRIASASRYTPNGTDPSRASGLGVL